LLSQQEIETLELVVLEKRNNDFNAHQVRLRFHRDTFVKDGYTLYRPIRGVKYRIVYNYDFDFKVTVTAVTQRGRGYTIGVFRCQKEAEGWVKNTFSESDEYLIPQYANNALTKLVIQK
jgi:hypothetical protein